MLDIQLVLSRPMLGLSDLLELERLISELIATSAIGLAEIQRECERRGLMIFLIPEDTIAVAFYQD